MTIFGHLNCVTDGLAIYPGMDVLRVFFGALYELALTF